MSPLAFLIDLLRPILPASAQTTTEEGLVPLACNQGPLTCGTCELIQTVNNVVGFIIDASILLAVIALVYGGFRLVVSGGDLSAKESAKRILGNIFLGLVFILGAFILIDTIMKGLLPADSDANNWSEVICIYPEEPELNLVEPPRIGGQPGTPPLGDPSPDDPIGGDPAPIAGGACRSADLVAGNACYEPGRCTSAISDGTISGACGRIAAFNSLITQASARYGVPAARIRAIIIVESNGNPNAGSSAGAIGLMQVIPSTARAYCNLSASELRDPAKNIDCGTHYYSQMYRQFGSHDLAVAAYNGGPGANGASRDCPGLRQWQCPFNSGGCCTNNVVTGTSCSVNTGYQETRTYVDKINRAMACG